MREDKPCDDYEACGDCGFDHGYEQPEAVKAHVKLDVEKGKDEFEIPPEGWVP